MVGLIARSSSAEMRAAQDRVEQRRRRADDAGQQQADLELLNEITKGSSVAASPT
jgi:hypothetical protein